MGVFDADDDRDFEDGVLKPTSPIGLPERTEVRITIEPLEYDREKAEKLASLEALWRIRGTNTMR